MDLETSLKPIAGPESLSDDPDWSLPGNPEPPEDRRVAVHWYLAGPTLQGPQVPKLQIGVTFRDANGVEIVGTFLADLLWEYPASISAANAGARSSWKKIGVISVAQNSLVPIELDVGGSGTLALRLHSMSAEGASTVHVAAQQWGAS